METPEKPSLECFSSFHSSSNVNISDLLSIHESSESQKSREEGFSCSILMNLKENNAKPASRLINITQLHPGQHPRKLLLPLFYQENSEEESYLPRSRRSFSMDSKRDSFTLYPPAEPKKMMTITTVNTQSNTELGELNPDFLREKEKFEFEKLRKESNSENNQFGVHPCIFCCNLCGFSGVSVVRRSRERNLWAFKIFQRAICCCFNRGDEERVEHFCPNCQKVAFSLLIN